MNRIKCPYCKALNKVRDFDSLDEERRYEMKCGKCKKNFVFTATMSIDYQSFKADCLNGEPHRLEESRTHPKRYAKMCCQDCDHMEPLSQERMLQILKEEKR